MRLHDFDNVRNKESYPPFLQPVEEEEGKKEKREREREKREREREKKERSERNTQERSRICLNRERDLGDATHAQRQFR